MAKRQSLMAPAALSSCGLEGIFIVVAGGWRARDGSQESCSDSGLGDQEPSSTASTATQPLPLGFPQDPYYEQASPSSRTEGDGNSDPESIEDMPIKGSAFDG
ncbi:unnamed protein product [Arctogadus glacialis]